MDNIKVTETTYLSLEDKINEIGYKNILQIIPRNDNKDSLFVIIYME